MYQHSSKTFLCCFLQLSGQGTITTHPHHLRPFEEKEQNTHCYFLSETLFLSTASAQYYLLDVATKEAAIAQYLIRLQWERVKSHFSVSYIKKKKKKSQPDLKLSQDITTLGPVVELPASTTANKSILGTDGWTDCGSLIK